MLAETQLFFFRPYADCTSIRFLYPLHFVSVGTKGVIHNLWRAALCSRAGVLVRIFSSQRRFMTGVSSLFCVLKVWPHDKSYSLHLRFYSTYYCVMNTLTHSQLHTITHTTIWTPSRETRRRGVPTLWDIAGMLGWPLSLPARTLQIVPLDLSAQVPKMIGPPVDRSHKAGFSVMRFI